MISMWRYQKLPMNLISINIYDKIFSGERRPFMKTKYALGMLGAMTFLLSGCVSALPMDNKQIVYATYHPAKIANTTESFVEPILTTEIQRIEKVLAQAPEDTVFDSEASGDGLPWIISVTQEATPTIEIQEYEIVTDQDGNVVSKKYLEDNYQYNEGTPEIASYGGQVAVGSYFYPKTTTYGVDCSGCNGETTGTGGTSLGIKLDIQKGVRQSNGSFQPGITYNGYYIVAADKNIPLGSILEISEHSYSGAGLTPGVPFKAIVADRGGGVNGAHLDIYIGSEKSGALTRTGSNQVKAKIICLGRSCS